MNFHSTLGAGFITIPLRSTLSIGTNPLQEKANIFELVFYLSLLV